MHAHYVLDVLYWQMMDAAEKSALVRLQTLCGSHNRVVNFRGGKNELLLATKAKLNDLLCGDGELYLQIKDGSGSWGLGDVYIDHDTPEIPPKSVLNAVEIKKTCYFSWDLYFI